MADARAIDDGITFEIWPSWTLARGRRWYWHCINVDNGEIVCSGQSSGYSSKEGAKKGVDILRGTHFATPVRVLDRARR